MKRSILVAFALSLSMGVNAQSAKVVSARNYLNEFEKSKDADYLSKAKEAIDLASQHPDTKDLPKTNLYRGQVYLAMFENNLRKETEKQTATIPDPKKREMTVFQNVPSTELVTAYEAYAKAKASDAKGNWTTEISDGISKISNYFNNKAVYDYNGKHYAESMASFEKAYEIGGSRDTNLLYNCALTADRSGNFDKAKQYYSKMIENKQGRGNTYSALVNVYLSAKDTTGGMEVLKKGRAAYPNDIALLISETNYYLKTNKSPEALANLNQAILAKPEDANLYLVRGNIYDNLGNPKDNSGKEIEKPKDYETLLKNAENDYKKAVELKPDYFDALYNLGVLYNNHGVAISKLADKITDNAKYTAENEKATAEFNKAMPLLEKALIVNPNDKGTMIALKQIYARTQQLDKLKEMNEKIKSASN
jgi:tetratricopeptide (TPR) repeat protein